MRRIAWALRQIATLLAAATATKMNTTATMMVCLPLTA